MWKYHTCFPQSCSLPRWLLTAVLGSRGALWAGLAQLVYFYVQNDQRFPFSLIQVTFLNEVTEEYLFYMVTFKATALGPIGTVEMTTAIRQSVSSTVKVDNPLPIPVTFAIDCKVPDINVPPHFTVPAQSEVGAKLIWYSLLSLPSFWEQVGVMPSMNHLGLLSEGDSSHLLIIWRGSSM